MNIKEIKRKVANIVEAAAVVGGVLFIPAALIWAFYSEIQDWETDPHNCEYNPCYWGCSDTDKADEYAELCEIQQCSEDPYLPQCKSNKYNYLRNENNEQEQDVAEDVVKDVVEEKARPSVEEDPAGFCKAVFIRSKFKDGVCHVEIKTRIKDQEHLEKRLDNGCEVSNIRAGKKNTTLATANCNGLPMEVVMHKFGKGNKR